MSQHARKILVLGASGLIGRYLTDDLRINAYANQACLALQRREFSFKILQLGLQHFGRRDFGNCGG